MKLINDKEIKEINKKAYEYMTVAIEFMNEKSLSKINTVITNLNDLIKLINENRNNSTELIINFKNIYDTKNKNYMNIENDFLLYRKKVFSRLNYKSGNYAPDFNTEQLLNIFKGYKYINDCKKILSELEIMNEKRKIFKIDKEIYLIKGKIKELKTIIKDLFRNKKIVHINKINLNFTKNNHVIPKEYFKKWDKSGGIKPNVLVSKHHIKSKKYYKRPLLSLNKVKKISDKFHISKDSWIEKIKGKIYKIENVQLEPVSLDNFMSIHNCFIQSLENLFTSYTTEQTTTEKIYFLDRLENALNKKQINFMLRLENDTNYPFSIYTKLKEVKDKQEKYRLVKTLEVKQNDMIQLKLFCIFLSARSEFAKMLCKAIIKKENNKYHLIPERNLSIQNTYLILNKIMEFPNYYESSSDLIVNFMKNRTDKEPFQELKKILEIFYENECLANYHSKDWFDCDLSSYISSLFLMDLVSNEFKRKRNDFLIISCELSLNTSCYPVVHYAINNSKVIFIAYSPNVLLVNGTSQGIEEVENFIKNNSKETLAKLYNELIMENQFYITA